ncbi:hypothetical protein [Pseudomonas fluorescens]|nr:MULTISPECIES: hypothetical protein [Pseudomonas]
MSGADNAGVDYPCDLARITAGSADEVAAAWPRIKQSPQAVAIP